MAMRKPGVGLAALLLLGLVVAAAAPAGAEGFVDLYLGKSFTRSSDVRIRQSSLGSDFSFEDVTFDDRSFDSPQYYGGRGGYFFEAVPWFGVGLEFFHFKMYADTADVRRVDGVVAGAPVGGSTLVSTLVQRFDISHGVNYATV